MAVVAVTLSWMGRVTVESAQPAAHGRFRPETDAGPVVSWPSRSEKRRTQPAMLLSSMINSSRPSGEAVAVNCPGKLPCQGDDGLRVMVRRGWPSSPVMVATTFAPDVASPDGGDLTQSSASVPTQPARWPLYASSTYLANLTAIPAELARVSSAGSAGGVDGRSGCR